MRFGRKAKSRKGGKNQAAKSRGRVKSTLELLEERQMLTSSPFVGGDLVVLRMGEGNVGLSNSGNVISLDEYTPTGTLVSSTEMPFNNTQSPLFNGGTPSPAVGGTAPNPLVGSGSAAPTGYISLSSNGQYLTFDGYDVDLPFNGSTSLKSQSASSVPRTVGVIDINKSLDDTTALTDLAAGSAGSSNTPTAAVSPDGVHLYAGSSQEGDLRYATVNDANPTTNSTEVNSASGDPLLAANAAGTESIYNGVLYVNNATSIYQITKAAGDPGVPGYPALPTMAGALAVKLPGISTPTDSKTHLGDFFFVTLNPTAHPGVGGVGLSQPDTLYVANSAPSAPDTTSGEIDKFTATAFDPNTGAPTQWAFSGYVQATEPGVGGVTGLTGYSTGSSVIMFAQAGNAGSKNEGGGGALFTFTDNSGYNATGSTITSYMTGYDPNGGGTGVPSYATANTIATVSTSSNEGFRGIAFAPNQAPSFSAPVPVNFASSIPENAANASNPGELVSQLISAGGGVTDTVGSHQGIAITAADQTNGTWQFSLNGGTTWTSFPAVSSTTALTLASDASTTVRFVPNANYNGSASLTFSAWDQSRGVNGGTFVITATGGGSPFSTNSVTATQTVSYVNQAPSFVRGLSQSILNTAGAQTVNTWATQISPGGSNPNSLVQETGQTVNFIVNNNNNALFTVQPTISANGTLTYTPSATANGTATVTVQLHDNGGTLNGGQNTSASQTFQISVTPVGSAQPPVNTIPFSTQSVLENGAVPTTLVFNSTNQNLISFVDPNPGSSSATDQIALTVSGGVVALSGLTGLTGTGSGTSSLSYSGTVAALNLALNGLVFTPTADSISPATITLATTAVTGSGSPTATDTINIGVVPVNQPPSFTPGNNVTVSENSPTSNSSYSAAWATGITAGPNESGQSVAFSVSVNNPALFAVQPSISANGTLTFTPALYQFGTAVVNVTLQDSGGTANGGIDTYVDPNPLLINIAQVNQPPVNTLPGPQHLIENTPLVLSAAEFNGITVSDIDGFNNTEQVTLTATDGTLTLPAGTFITSGTSTTLAKLTQGTGTNDTTLTLTGTLSSAGDPANFGELNAALNGLIFTPTNGFTGAASITVATDDLSTVAPTNLTTTSVLPINVVTAPPLVISQILENPPGGIDSPNQYLEIQGAPNYTIPNGTYIVSVSGSYQSFTAGSQLENYPTGTVFDTFNLSGVVTGSDGVVVILQNGNTYTNTSLYGIPNGYGVIDNRATVLDNTSTLGAGAGFGNNTAAPGSSGVGHNAIFRANGDIDLFKPSATYMLINSPNAAYDPRPGDELDEPLNVTPSGALHGAEYNSWDVYDSVGITQAQVVLPGDVSYGYINFVDTSKPSYTNHAGTQSSTTIPVSFTPDFVARTNTDLGSIASDWVATSGLKGQPPYYGLGSVANTQPSSFAGLAINNIGGPNFDEVPANVVTTTTGTTSFALSGTPPTSVVIDSGVVVSNPQQNTATGTNANPNAYFLGSATVTISTNFNTTTDSLTFNNTPTISGNFSPTTGVLTLTGFDSMSDWNAALQSVSFTYDGSVVTNASRTITFAANDGVVASNLATKQITILAATVSPPIVTGTSTTPLQWTEALPPAAAQVLTVAPALAIADTSTGQLTSATVQISSNFSSGEDVLGWSATAATANGITVTASAHFNHLTLTPTSPATTASLAAFQAVLQTVTYSDSSENPSTAARTISFTVVDSNSITSSTTTSSQQVINMAAVNNPPTTTTTSGSDSYTAGDPAILVDGGVTVTDPDSALLGPNALPGVIVSITGGFQPGDTLGFLNQDGITGSYNASTGVLTLSGAEPALNYELALQVVTFSTSVGAAGGTRTISFQADDGVTDPVVDGNIATKQIVVVGSLATPVVSTTSGNDSYAIEAAAIPVDAGVTVTDPNPAPSLSATVSITGGFLSGDTLNFTNQNGITGTYTAGTGVLTLTGGGSSLANYQTALQSISFSSTSVVAGARTISFTVTDGATTSTAATKTVNVMPFEVTSFTPNSTGFVIGLDAAPNLSVLNLYSGSGITGAGLGAPDLTVMNGSTAIQGSLVWDPTSMTATFVQTRGILAPGTYNVTMVSGSSAWVDTHGNLLDGGVNYTNSFPITAPTAAILTLPDFARGPGQPVNVSDAPSGYGNGTTTLLPVALSSTAGVTSVSFELDYNSSYLTISNVALAAGISGTLSVTNTTPGVLLVSITGFSSTASAGAIGGTDILDITATVPAAAISSYGASALLKVVNPLINGAAVPTSDSVEKVAYFGDASGDGKVGGADATLIARNKVHLDSGFNAYPLTDPRLVADISGTGVLTSLDASQAAQVGVHITVPSIPTVPSHGALTLAGADPTVSIPSNIAATAGQTVNVPVSITDDADGVAYADFEFHFDPTLLQSSNVTLGSTLVSAMGWTLESSGSLYNSEGILYVSIFASAGLMTGTPVPATLLNLTFTVGSDAPTGSTPITIDPDPNNSDIGSATGALTLSIANGSVAITGSQTAPMVTVSDLGGPYTGSPYPAMAQVNGGTSLEGVTPTLAYYVGSTATGTPTATPPTTVGTYTVVANFAGSTDYSPASSNPLTFNITQATPSVTASDLGGPYTGSPYPATAHVNGGASLEGTTPTLAYYVGSTATGTPTATPPTTVGTYTVVANFAGSTDYAPTSSSPATFNITQATPSVTVSDLGGPYTGSPYPATAHVNGGASLEGTTPTLAYYVGSTATGTPTATPPTTAGTYTVVANFAGSTDYAPTSSSPVTFNITQLTPSVTVGDLGGPYTGSPYPATAHVNGGASLEGTTPTLAYYVGSTATGTPSATPPTTVGTYTVVANFAGSTDYAPNSSSPVTFNITQATPSVTVSDLGGPYTGSPYPATAHVNGGASLEGTTPTLAYYVGSTATGTPSATPPTTVGTYTVVANFAGSTDYAPNSSSPVTFNITQATPSVTVIDLGGTYTGNPYPATAMVNGLASLEGITPTLAYYVGSTATGTPSATAPSAAGTYTVVANFAGSTDYAPASSSPVTFGIGDNVPAVTVSDAGGPYTGNPYPATAMVDGLASLEGVTPTLAYYVGSTATGTPSATPPSAAGTYTVVAHFGGSADYTAASSSPATFNITQLTPSVTVSDLGGPYTGSPYPAMAQVNGGTSLEGITPTLAYYVGSTATGTPSATPPTTAGTYTVVANFAGSTDYAPNSSSPVTFSITQLTPSVTVSDLGGPYTGSPYPATAHVNGGASLEGTTPTLAYYVGSTATGTPSATPPTTVGTYTVVANFAGSTDYAPASSSPATFNITQATPSVTVSDLGGPYTGSPYPATAHVNGGASLEGITPTLAYYVGSTATGTPSATPPTTVGTYTVVANFAGSTDYAPNSSSPVTFNITQATPSVTVSDAGGTYTGSAFPATAHVNGGASLEGITPTLAYYVGSTATGTPSATPPSAVGTYTVVANFAGSTDYAPASSSPVTFIINPTVNPFTPGDIVVVQVGASGATAALGDTGSAVFLDEYTPSGVLVQQIPLPTIQTPGGNQSLVLGNGSSEGLLSLSTDGKDLLLAGFDEATLGTLPAGGASTTKIENTIPTGTGALLRTIGEVTATGSVNTTTVLNNFAGAGDPRGVVGSDATGFWLGGQDSTSGVGYIASLGSGTTAMTDLSNGATAIANARGVEIWNGQLYLAQNKSATSSPIIGALDATSGSLQTSSTGTTVNFLPGSGVANLTSPGTSSKTSNFFFAKVGSSPDFQINGTDSGYNTLYVADENTTATNSTPGITKYSWTGSNWASNGTIGSAALSFEGLTGTVSGTTVTLYATVVNPTAGNYVVSITDNSGFGAAITNNGSTTPTTLNTTASVTTSTIPAADLGEAYRGIAFAPDDGAQPITGLGGTTNYTVGGAATVVGGAAAFSDTSSFNGGSLVVSGGQTGDVLAVNSAGQISVSSGIVSYAGTQIGTLSGGTGTTPLTIAFDSVVNTNGAGGTEYAVTSAAIQALMNQVTFSSSGAGGSRTVTFTVNKNSATNIAGAYGTLNTPASDSTTATQTVKVEGATPTVTVSDLGGPYTGSPYPATAMVNGGASLEGISPTLAYYVGSTATGTPSATPPSSIGTYTVVANFAGSTDYPAASSSPVTFSITQATPAVTVSDAGGPFTGNPYPATAMVNGAASLEGITPTLAYYVGNTATGTPSATPPSAAGTYTVVANFAGSTDYAPASSSPVTFGIGLTVPSVTVSDLGGPYTGSPYPATAMVNGGASLEGVAPTLAYYVGSTATGTPSATPPTTVGTYTVVANFAGTTDYAPASSSPVTFSITQLTPSVTVSDLGGPYTGSPYPATAHVNGGASLEGVALTLAYYVGSTATGTPSATPPTTVGTYTVVANFAGSTDYAPASSSPVTFSITQATPSVTVSDLGGPYTGSPYPATAHVNGGASLEGTTPTLAYYVGSTATGTPSATPPSTAGTYTVVANFAGSTDYAPASSSPVTFSITQVAPTVTVSDAGGTFTGNPFPATGLVNGGASLEGIAVTLAYYVGSTATGTPSATAPSAAGTYTVVANFAGSTDYSPASSSPVTFTINPASTINPFTPGDIVVVQVGVNGASTAPNDTGTAVFLDEYTPSGVLVQQIPMPTTASGSNNPFVLGNNNSEGLLNLSTDGKELLLAGYDTTVGGVPAGVDNGTGSTDPREVGVVYASGTIDTTTALTSGDGILGANVREAVGSAANGFYIAGQSKTPAAGGVAYVPLGGNTGVDLIGSASTYAGQNLTNARGVEIFNGQLYLVQNKNTAEPLILALDGTTSGTLQEPTNAFNAGTNPTSALPLPGSGTTNLSTPGSSSKTGNFFFAKVGSSPDFQINGTDSGYNTLYVADANNGTTNSTPGITKYSWTGSAWASNGTIGSSTLSFEGLTGSVSGTTVTLYATVVNPTAGNYVVSITDNSGFNAAITNNGSTTPTTLNSTASLTTSTIPAADIGEVYRGLAFAPDDGAQPITGLGGTTHYTPGGGAVAVGGPVAFSDTSSFNGGSLVVSGGQTGDVLAVNSVGTGAGQISVNSGIVSYGGTQIGTLSGGTGTTPLTIAFDSVVNTNGAGGTEYAVTSAAIQALMNQVTFSSTGGGSSRTVTFTVNKNSATNIAGAYGTLNTPASDATSASQTISLQATPTVTVSDAGGTFTGNPFAATALVNGGASLEGITPTLAYYVGSTATGTPSSIAPSAAGTYTVVANFAGSADYSAASSSPATFTITPATPAGNPFTPGDIVVVQIGVNGATGTLSDTGTNVYLDEYTPSGVLVQQIPMPTTVSGSNNPFVLGNNNSEGLLNLSTDGKELLLAGYDTTVGGVPAGVDNGTTADPREIGVVYDSGVIDTTTVVTSGDTIQGANVREAVGSAANGFYLAGQSKTPAAGGVAYVPLGGNTGTDLLGSAASYGGGVLTNGRGAEIFNGQLYMVQNKDVGEPFIVALDGSSTGLQLPTAAYNAGTNPTTALPLPGISSGSTLWAGTETGAKTGNFYFAKVGSSADFPINGVDSGYNTLYVADSGSTTTLTAPGITKYSWNNTTSSWTQNGTIGGASLSFEGIAGSVSGTTVTLYATVVNPTAGNYVVSITDNSGFGATITNNGSTTPTTVGSTAILAASTGEVYRGLAFAPDDGAQPIGGLGGTTNYSTGNPATVIGGPIAYSDASSFNGGSLVVSGGQTGDVLTVNNVGTGAGQISVSSGIVSYGGTQIGTLSGGTGTTPLTIAFDSVVNTNGAGGTEYAVTSAAIQALMNQVTFSSSGAGGNRTVTFTVNKNSATNIAGAYGTLNTPASDATSASQTINVAGGHIPPQQTNDTGLTVAQSSTTVITSSDLLYSSADSPTTLTYNVTSGPTNGAIQVGGVAVTSFTQAQINGGLVSYVQNGSDTTSDSFSFTVTDAESASSAPATFSIAITAPVLVHNTGATVNPNAAVVLTTAMLDTTESGVASSGLTYTIGATAPANGTLTNTHTSTTLTSGSSFTQADIDNGYITYTNTVDTASSDSFTFTVTDGSTGSTGLKTFALTINQAPQPAVNTGATVAQSSTTIITSSMLSYTSVVASPAQLTYTISTAPVNGSIQIGGSTVTSFTQAQINAGSVSYVQNGSDTTSDSFSFKVADNLGNSAPTSAFNIVITAPVLVNNTGTTVQSGSAVVLTTAMLDTTESGVASSGLTYTIGATGLANGTLTNTHTSTTLSSGSSFTQADIDSGYIKYTNTNAAASTDSFAFTVTDGATGSTGAHTFAVAINHPPTIAVNTGLNVNPGQSATISSALLSATDPDAGQTLTYTVTTLPTAGTIYKTTAVGTAGTALAINGTFTQAQLNSGLVYYLSTGSTPTTDSFAFTVSDGSGGSVSGTFAANVVALSTVSYTGGTYSQNFDGLPSSGTYDQSTTSGLTAPLGPLGIFGLYTIGPVALDSSSVPTTGLAGWSMAVPAADTQLKFETSDGPAGQTTGAVYSYGSGPDTPGTPVDPSSDRALGLVGTSSNAATVGLTLVNNSGGTLNQLNIAYDGQLWHEGTASFTQQLVFNYSLAATNIIGASSNPANNTNGFTNVPSLSYSVTSTGTGGAFDGNAPANNTPVSGTITGLTWGPGQTLVLTWTIIGNAQSPGLAIDNFSFSAVTNTTPTVTVSDPGGTYDGTTSFPATALVNGATTLEGIAPTLAYYVGTTATGTPSSTAPVAAGTYTVVANFPGSADYEAASSAPVTFTVAQATPTVMVSDPGGTYDGTTSFPATGLVNGGASLEGIAPTLAYYVGSTATGTPSSTAPVAAGTYTVVANFGGSTNYAAASSTPLTFQVTGATPTVTVSDPGGTYDGTTSFPATALVNGSPTLEGVAPTYAYYVGSTATGTPSSTAPKNAGTYTVVANFPGSTDYVAASSSPVTFSIGKATPTVTVSDAGGPFTNNLVPATALINGAASLEGVSATLAYYVGSTATGTPTSTAPSAVGTYTVVANFAGSADYGPASSNPVTFTISQATPIVTVNPPASGIYTGNPFVATATVTGVGGAQLAVATTITYTNLATSAMSTTAPTAPGSYSVVASYAGSTDYLAASSSPALFTITPPVPTVSVSDLGGPYTGNPYPAAALVNGAASLEGVAPTLAYYVGSTATGTPTSTPPSAAGTYTVVANFAGSTDYAPSSSSPVTFAVNRATPSVTVSDAGGPSTGNPYPGTAMVNGAASLEGVTPTLAYYVGSTATGTPSSTPPSAAGTYTVVANFGGSADYAPASSSPATFVITPVSTSVNVGIPLGIAATAGQVVNVPVSITNDANGVASADFAFDYDPTKLSITTTDITLGSSLTSAGWGLSANVDSADGIVYVTIYGTAGLPTGMPQLLNLAFTVAGNAPTGTTPINIDPANSDVSDASSHALNLTVSDGSVAITALLTPSVTVSDAGGPYTGNPYPATAQVNGAASLEGVAPTLTYYVGNTATGTPSATAPSAVGTYTVVANFAGSTDYAPASSSPVTFTISTPQVTLSVEKGLSERSYIRYVDLTFNTPIAGLDLNSASITLTHYNLDGTLNAGNGVTNLGVESLSGVTLSQLTDHVMELDFGAGGIGGNENLANTIGNWASLTSADGIYKLTIDPDGTGQHDITETFYRMFGDVAGNTTGGATVTGGATGIGAVATADVTAITNALGQTSSGVPVNADVNGAGSVTANDRALVAKSIGRHLAAGIHIDD